MLPLKVGTCFGTPSAAVSMLLPTPAPLLGWAGLPSWQLTVPRPARASAPTWNGDTLQGPHPGASIRLTGLTMISLCPFGQPAELRLPRALQLDLFALGLLRRP